MNKIIENRIFWIGIYVCMFLLALVFIQQLWFTKLFNEINFLNWDAEHYQYIKEKGYKDFRVAFFPLFPLFWKLLSVNTYAIVIINGLIFLFSFYLLIKYLKIRKIELILLYLSIPSFIFFYLPYSEALFFVFSAIILLGIRNKKDYLIYIGLFLSILSRPAFTIFIPALLILEFLGKREQKRNQRILTYLLITVLGLMVVGVIQYLDTGKWFEFFNAQKGWGNHLQLPKLPLTSWAGGFIVRTDGFACLIGGIAGTYLLYILLNSRRFSQNLPQREIIFSLAYLGGITLSVLMFRGGSLFSLNRFVFATPFIILVLNYWITKEIYLTIKKIIYIGGLIMLFWLLFGSYAHLREMTKFTMLSLYALLIFAMKSDKLVVQKISLYGLILLNFSFQIIFFVRFLQGDWVG